MSYGKIIRYIQSPILDLEQIDWRKILKVAYGLVVLAGLFLLREPILDILQIIKDKEAVIEYVSELGIWGPLILSVTIVLQVIVAAIPGHLLMVAAGYLYGFSKGLFLCWVTQVVASQFTFYLARKAGKPLVYKLASPKVIDRWDRIASRQGVAFFIFSFILPIFPADVMSYVAGFSEISPRRFLVANVIGHIPVAVLMNMAGAYGFELSTSAVVITVIISIVMFLAWLQYGKRIEEKITQEQEGK
jgi:uncharacterized membrane protein YdjX (TVP38/TMEM64 family)